MDHAIAQLIAERIASGLKRKSLTTCSRWAQACRVMGRPYPGAWSFDHHPWLREMHDSEAEMNIGQKSAQVGFTETALNVTFYNIDVKGVDTLYVLPAQTPDASDFSAARFDPALEMSPHLMNLFSDVKNVGHKRAGNTNLYIRGSKSRSGLKSIPVGLIILDEVDEMEQDNIPLALERAAGQVEKMVWAISTPTIPSAGINKLFLDSTQEHFMFKCPCCSRLTELVFPECLKITAEDVNDPGVKNSHLICRECKGVLEHATKTKWLADGKWFPTFTDREPRGFHVNQMYSSTVSPVALATSYLKALRDPSEDQEFHNSKLGLPRVVEGAGVTDQNLEDATGDYKTYESAPRSNGYITMGIDVGRWLHYEIDLWHIPPGLTFSTDLNVLCACQVLKQSKIMNFEELDMILRLYGVDSVVIDANPERRKAYEFASRFPGRVKMCFYGMGVQGKQINVAKEETGSEPTITVDRTSWLDLALGRFRSKNMIKIPVDTPVEYKNHIKALVRVPGKDKNGNPTASYVKPDSIQDHYAHARNYAEIALPFALSLATNQDIDGRVV